MKDYPEWGFLLFCFCEGEVTEEEDIGKINEHVHHQATHQTATGYQVCHILQPQ
jgi:hypothetical protein